MTTNARILVEAVMENEKQIGVLHEQRENFTKANAEEIDRIKRKVYEPKIRALQNDRDQKIRALQTERDGKRKEIDGKIDGLFTMIGKVERILALLKLKKKDLTIKDEDVRAYGTKHIESLGYAFNDEFLKIKMFIVENDKPKNMYSLVAIGKCQFDRDMAELRYSYCLPCHAKGWHNLEALIRDLPTIAELKQYWQKHERSIVERLLGKYWMVKTEYLEVLKTYNIEDFRDLLKYRCGACGFFYTKRDILHIHIRAECKCPRCGETMKAVEEEDVIHDV
ncbi:MAG: hypothetical protein OEY30_00215 [Candidatus Bathyarchaeota archaeon]|nr:hypothetical protein [Candidatus Bathyarchaeota archaeon]